MARGVRATASGFAALLSRSTGLAPLALGAVWAATAGPVLLSGSRWGIWDWDHHFAFAEIERQAVLDHGVLPLWNPYIAGGMPALQHPLSSVFCPDFAVVLLLGAPLGLKLLVALRLAVGLLGGFVLGRALGLEALVAAFLSILASASGAYTAHLLYGHSEWSLLGYLPWTLLALLRFAEAGRLAWGVAASAGIALLYLGGGVYHLFALAFFSGALALVEAARSRSPARLARIGAPFAVAAALGGAKLLPAFELFRDHPRRLEPMKALFAPAPPQGPWEIARALDYMFLQREVAVPLDPEFLRHRPAKDYSREHLRARIPVLDFVNYSAYVGLVPVLLLPFAFIARAPHAPGVAAGTGLLLLLALSDPIGRSMGVYPWEALRSLPVLGTLRTSGRFLAVGVLGLSILSALGLQELLRRWRPARPLTAWAFSALVLLATAADQAARNVAALSRAFPYPPQPTEPAPEFVTYLLPVAGFDYATVRAGVGAVAGHSNLFLRPGVKAQGQDAYRGEAYLSGAGHSAELLEIRPNEVEVALEVRDPDVLVVNQTFASGWRRTDREARVFRSEGRLATEVAPGDRRVRLEYRPALLSPGVALSLATALGLATLLFRDLRRSRGR